MCRVVASTAHRAADEAYPKVDIGAANGAFVESGVLFAVLVVTFRYILLRVPAHRAAATAPLLQTGAVEDMLAEYCEEAGGLVHALKADRAGGEFDERRGGWSNGFLGGEGRGGCGGREAALG